jgi:hypothetical protein
VESIQVKIIRDIKNIGIKKEPEMGNSDIQRKMFSEFMEVCLLLRERFISNLTFGV